MKSRETQSLFEHVLQHVLLTCYKIKVSEPKIVIAFLLFAGERYRAKPNLIFVQCVTCSLLRHNWSKVLKTDLYVLKRVYYCYFFFIKKMFGINYRRYIRGEVV